MSRSRIKTYLISGRKVRVKHASIGTWDVIDKVSREEETQLKALIMRPRKPPLRALGVSAQRNHYNYGPGISPGLLERFPRPHVAGNALKFDLELSIEVPEFTALCPITGQPDFATLNIKYVPDKWCVESKSLKLYLMSFRQSGAFHEQCLATVCGDLVTLLDPVHVTITGAFGARGGIAFNPTITYDRPNTR